MKKKIYKIEIIIVGLIISMSLMITLPRFLSKQRSGQVDRLHKEMIQLRDILINQPERLHELTQAIPFSENSRVDDLCTPQTERFRLSFQRFMQESAMLKRLFPEVEFPDLEYLEYSIYIYLYPNPEKQPTETAFIGITANIGSEIHNNLIVHLCSTKQEFVWSHSRNSDPIKMFDPKHGWDEGGVIIHDTKDINLSGKKKFYDNLYK